MRDLSHQNANNGQHLKNYVLQATDALNDEKISSESPYL